MSDDYPQLDEAMMNSLVDDYENKPNLNDMVVPLPPVEEFEIIEPIINFDDLPSFTDETKGDGGFLPMEVLQANEEIVPNTLLPVKTQGISVNKEVENLELLENVFDKRVTDEQVQQQIKQEQNKNDSGRLLDKKDVEVKTELNDKEIVTIAKLDFISDRYHIPVLKEFTHNIMMLKISRHRKGRTEFIQGLHADERREQPNEGFLSKIFGGGNR